MDTGGGGALSPVVKRPAYETEHSPPPQENEDLHIHSAIHLCMYILVYLYLYISERAEAIAKNSVTVNLL
jgi:hypothetical protein